MQGSKGSRPGHSLRFNVIGSSGSGKSTFSRKLASILNIPHIEIDGIFWGPNWKEPDDEEFFKKLRNAISGDSWVLDGNYTRAVDIKWERVETVVWIDYSFIRTFTQSVKRATKRAYTKEELWPGTGNRESFRQSFFSKDSIILWSVQNYWKIRSRCQSAMEDENYSHIEFVRLCTPADAESYLKSIKIEAEPVAGNDATD
ncbi:MAG: hypothetical protein AB3N14_09855 [Flavobacteriaceae bacterium]